VSTHRLLLAAVVSGLLAAPQDVQAERPLPDWAEWEASRAIRSGERALVRSENEVGLRQALRAAQLAPEQPLAWSLLTRAYTRLHDWTAARESSTRWLQLAPKDRQALLLAGRVHVEARDLAKARTLYKSVATQFPSDPGGPLGLALCAGLAGAWEEVEDQLHESRRRQPEADLASLPLRDGWSAVAARPEFIAALERVLQAKTPAP